MSTAHIIANARRFENREIFKPAISLLRRMHLFTNDRFERPTGCAARYFIRTRMAHSRLPTIRIAEND
jgi:hypothetical protein